MRSTRSSKGSTTPSKENINHSQNPKSVFLIKDNLLSLTSTHSDVDNGERLPLTLTMKRLRHPGTEEPAYFIVLDNKDNDQQLEHQIFEIMEFNQPHRSWFINESVTSNGRLYVTLPMDSLFFALHYLKKQCENQAKLLHQLEDDEYPATIDVLVNFITSEKLSKIADEKGPKDYRAYKYNHDKTMKWLKLKTMHLSRVLRTQNVNAGLSATSANYTKGGDDNFSDCSESEYLQLATDIIGAYITADLHDELKLFLGINTIATNKRKSLPLNSSESNKRVKVENYDEMKSSSSQVQSQKDKKQTTKEKSLAKAATGTKNISSFFQKKNK